MKAPIAVLAAALLAGCAGSDADPWTAQASLAASAQAGVNSLVASFPASRDVCDIGATPVIEVVQQGALGVASVGAATETIAAPDEACDGQPLPAAGLYYDAPAGVAAVDTVVVRELGAGSAPDVVHTVLVRVR